MATALRSACVALAFTAMSIMFPLGLSIAMLVGVSSMSSSIDGLAPCEGLNDVELAEVDEAATCMLTLAAVILTVVLLWVASRTCVPMVIASSANLYSQSGVDKANKTLCAVMCGVCVLSITKFVFLVLFTIDVAGLDAACASGEYSSLDTFWPCAKPTLGSTFATVVPFLL